jgi:hypothetical protein
MQKLIQLSIASMILFASVIYAQPSFMLGAKTFTLDFKGYSGFMLELGLGQKINFQTYNDDLVWGIQSGFGYSSKDYSEDDMKIEASSIAIPIKLFFSQRLLGLNMGVLLSFWDTKISVDKKSTKDVNDDGMAVHFDVGLMIFPVESFSINFDVITKSSVTGFAIGAAYHFGKERSQENQHNDGYDIKKDCSNGTDFILNAFIEEEGESINVCIKLKDGKLSCLELDNRLDFRNKSLETIENFDAKSSHLKWNEIPVNIPYSEFFPNGFCD